MGYSKMSSAGCPGYGYQTANIAAACLSRELSFCFFCFSAKFLSLTNNHGRYGNF
jgi:hypothetical protein